MPHLVEHLLETVGRTVIGLRIAHDDRAAQPAREVVLLREQPAHGVAVRLASNTLRRRQVVDRPRRRRKGGPRPRCVAATRADHAASAPDALREEMGGRDELLRASIEWRRGARTVGHLPPRTPLELPSERERTTDEGGDGPRDRERAGLRRA